MKHSGFTLIELLVVIAIIGILAAIAIPQFNAYKVRAKNASAESTAKNFMTAQEAFFLDNDAYSNCTGTGGCVSALPGFEADPAEVNVVAGSQVRWGDPDPSFRVYVCHLEGDMRYAIRTDTQGSLTATPISLNSCAGFS